MSKKVDKPDDESLLGGDIYLIERVLVLGPDDCWPWQGGTNEDGYGKAKRDGKTLASHRLTFFATSGYWPEPCCLHTCDNPPCCNPAHLYEGDWAQNAKDKSDRGRWRGSRKCEPGCECGRHDPRERKPVSAETRIKISAAMKGRQQSEIHKARKAAAMRGQKRTPEQRARMSAAQKGARNG